MHTLSLSTPAAPPSSGGSIPFLPEKDKPEFAALVADCKAEVLIRLRVFERLLPLRNPQIGRTIAAEAPFLGMEAKGLRKLWDKFRHSGCNWRVAINRRSYPAQEDSGSVPPEVISLWRKLCERNQRAQGNKAAHRELMRIWARGEPLPNGAEWPETIYTAEGPVPRGCSYRNLTRKRPEDGQLLAARLGLGAALSSHGPHVLTTRVGLWVGSHYMIDDVKRDVEFMLLGHGGQIVNPQELGVLDLFSADRFAVHRRPIYVDAKTGRKDHVKEREMRFLAASVFRNTGYSRKGTQIVAELGTAAIRDRLKKWLHAHSHGAITVREPGLMGKEQAIAGYWGSGGGNPRHKAALESHHNLLHNEAGNLPAQTGNNRQPPEWLHGLGAMTEQVLKWMRELPPERAALLQAFHLSWWPGCALLDEIDHRIAWRTDHALEGWSQNVVVEYLALDPCDFRDTGRWVTQQELFALPEPEAKAIVKAAAASPALRRCRQLAPREVFARGAAELVRIPDVDWALYFCDRELGDDLRLQRPKRLTADGKFELSDVNATPEPVYFQREVVTPEGGTLRLAERQDFTVAFNPFDQSSLWVYDVAGRFLGTAPRIERASPLDVRAIEGALGRAAHEKAAMVGPVAERHLETTERIRAMQEENRRIAEGVTESADEARARARVERQAANVGRVVLEGNETAADAASAAEEVPATVEEWSDAVRDDAPATSEEW